MDFLSVLAFYLSVLRVTEACETTTYEFIRTILHPKSDAGFLTSRTCIRAECASDCSRTTNCWKFYHNPNDNTCFLASRTQMVVPDTSFSNTAENIFDMLTTSGFPAFTTCAALLQSHPGTEDGEYWLYPEAALLYNNAVKMYCHNMASGSPVEYMTLPGSNTGIYPEETYQKCNTHVYQLTGCPGQQGVYTYNKVKVDPLTMAVIRNDRTFISLSGKARDYAWAGDCYTELDNTYTCGPKGTFTVNTTSTGLMVDPTLTWVTEGYKAKVVMVTSEGGAVISLTCGGYPGNCVPASTMYLHPNTAEVVDPSMAAWLQ